jgi:8-oxo-dGTP pyrophosphatase MutT (NUDIX family)
MNRYQELAEQLFKAGVGEGAHGGKIIGHTRSGKAIYASSSHPEHATFSPAEHTDAMNHHHEIWSKTQDKIANIKTAKPNWHPPKAVHNFLQHHHTQMQMHQSRANRGLARQEAAKHAPSTFGMKTGHGVPAHPYNTPQNIHKGLNDIEVPFLAAVVIISPDRKQVLLGKRSDGKGWESPAGHADIGERPEDVAIREAFEEFNVPLQEEQLEHLPIMYKKDMTPIHCYMAVTTSDQIRNISCEDDPSEEHQKWKWFDLNGQLPDAMEDNRFNTIVHAKMKLAGIGEMAKSYELLDQTEGMSQMHTTEFATESEHDQGHQHQIEARMQDYKPGDVPVLIVLDSGAMLHLVKIDDGLYSGFVKKIDQDGLEETVANIDKMTIPAMVQFLRAKQVLEAQKPAAKPAMAEENSHQLKLVLEALSPKPELPGIVYVSMDGDNIGNRVAQAEAEDDEAKLQEISGRINAGQTVFSTWAGSVGGSIVESGGDEGLAKIPWTATASIDFFRKQYEAVVGATVTVGVGNTISESTKARQLGKLKGKNRIENFGPTTVVELQTLLIPKDEAQKILESGVLKLLKGEVQPIGSIKSWNGQHFRKEASGHWMPIAGSGGDSPDATAPASDLVTPEKDPTPTKESKLPAKDKIKPLAGHLKHLHPKEGMGGHVQPHSNDLKLALERGPFSMISADKNSKDAEDRGMTDEQVSKRSRKLEEDLKDLGHKYTKVKGKTNGSTNDSFLVYHADPEKMNELGKKYNQENVIHSSEGANRMHFTNGKNDGKHHKGSKHSMVPDAEDNFSEVSTSDGKRQKFNLNLDFGKLHD